MINWKLILVVLLYLLIGEKGSAQDIIVTMDSDTIHCEIAKEDEGFYYFTYYDQNGANTTLISKESVKNVEIDFEDYYVIHKTAEPISKGTKSSKSLRYQDFGSSQDDSKPQQKAGRALPVEAMGASEKEWPSLRVAIGGGYGRTLTGLPQGIGPSLEDYYRQLRSGPVFNSSLTWYYQEAIGLKLGFGYYQVSNEADLVMYNPDGSRTTGILRDDIRQSTIGLSLNWRRISANKKGILDMSSGAAWLGYLNRAAYFYRFETKSQTAVFISEISYDRKLSESIALGMSLNITVGVLSKYEYDDGFTQQSIQLPPGTYESLTHIDLCAGIRFLQ